MAAPRKKGTNGTWPLGDYLRDQRGRMSVRQAARRAEISESRWRQVEAGVQKMPTANGSVEVPVHPRPETVAAMCRAISADPRKGLELAGHNPDQYEWLMEPAVDQLTASDRGKWFATLPREDREAVLAELQRVHVDTEVQAAKRTTG